MQDNDLRAVCAAIEQHDKLTPPWIMFFSGVPIERVGLALSVLVKGGQVTGVGRAQVGTKMHTVFAMTPKELCDTQRAFYADYSLPSPLKWCVNA